MTTTPDYRTAGAVRHAIRVMCTNAGALLQAVSSAPMEGGWKLMIFHAPEHTATVQAVLTSPDLGWTVSDLFVTDAISGDATYTTAYVLDER